ncbi:MAG: hypothetical protein JO104_01915 [Candidatus Eremiobacteraeota bacterium]|nr:hypothetical protein [Candidatus Eremiobacteraeota bacterium]
MRISDLVRFGKILATATLVGCAGLRGGVTPPVTTPQGGMARASTRGGSWMARGLKQRALLYVSNANRTVSVYRYWQHTLVGVLTKFMTPMGECADEAGNVYITDRRAREIDEYAHGGKSPIAVLLDERYPEGCAVDPVSGDLGVANYQRGSISVYPANGGSPRLYLASTSDHFTSCAYDDHGDLLVMSYYSYSYGSVIKFYYLPQHGAQLLLVRLRPRHSGYGTGEGVAWDGKYWVVESSRVLSRFTINARAKYIDSIRLSGAYIPTAPIAIYRKTSKSLGTQVVGAATAAYKSAIEYWSYPMGGKPVGDIAKDLDAPYGIAISMRSQ